MAAALYWMSEQPITYLYPPCWPRASENKWHHLIQLAWGKTAIQIKIFWNKKRIHWIVSQCYVLWYFWICICSYDFNILLFDICTFICLNLIRFNLYVFIICLFCGSFGWFVFKVKCTFWENRVTLQLKVMSIWEKTLYQKQG